MYGTVREGKVYEMLKKPEFNLSSLRIPEAYFSYSNLETGMKVIILPDLSDLTLCQSFFENYKSTELQDVKELNVAC